MTHFAFELEGLTDPEPSTGLGSITEQIKKLREKLKTPGFITQTAQDLAKMGAQAPDLDNIPEDPLPPAPGTQAPGGLDLTPPQAGVPLIPSPGVGAVDPRINPTQPALPPPALTSVPSPGDLLNLQGPAGGQVPPQAAPVGGQGAAGAVQELKANAEAAPEALTERTSAWEKFLGGLEDNPDAMIFLLQMAAAVGRPVQPGESIISNVAQGAVQGLGALRQRQAFTEQKKVGEERLGIEQERLGLEERRVTLSEEEAVRKGDIAEQQLDLDRIRILATTKVAKAKAEGKTITPDKAELDLIEDFAKIALPSQQAPLIARARELAASISGVEQSPEEKRAARINTAAAQLPDEPPEELFTAMLQAQARQNKAVNPGSAAYNLVLEVLRAKFPNFVPPQ